MVESHSRRRWAVVAAVTAVAAVAGAVTIAWVRRTAPWPAVADPPRQRV